MILTFDLTPKNAHFINFRISKRKLWMFGLAALVTIVIVIAVIIVFVVNKNKTTTSGAVVTNGYGCSDIGK